MGTLNTDGVENLRFSTSKLLYFGRSTRGTQLQWKTNKKWHSGFRVVPITMTLNDRNVQIYQYRFFPYLKDDCRQIHTASSKKR